MREIKFRAYAPEQERMLSWKELIGYHDLDSLFGYIDDTDNIWLGYALTKIILRN